MRKVGFGRNVAFELYPVKTMYFLVAIRLDERVHFAIGYIVENPSVCACVLHVLRQLDSHLGIVLRRDDIPLDLAFRAIGLPNRESQAQNAEDDDADYTRTAPNRTLTAHYATLSSANAIPIPPLTHNVATPRFDFRRSISYNRVTVIRVPVQPMGCPSAIDPPFTFSRARSKCSSRSQAMTCAAKASFNSTRSKSATLRPCFSSSLCMAGTGPMPMVRGSTPADVTATMRASGFRLCLLTNASLATTTAAAPSVMPDELAAVIVPAFENTGARAAIFSSVAPGNGCSSRVTTCLPFLPSIVTVAISASKRPASI